MQPQVRQCADINFISFVFFNAQNFQKCIFRSFREANFSKFPKIPPGYGKCFPTAFRIFVDYFIIFNFYHMYIFIETPKPLKG